MVARGRKPKPPLLRLVGGNAGHRKIPDDVLVDMAHDNKLEPPVRLKKREQELWNTFVRPLAWLAPSDAAMAVVFIKLLAQFERNPTMTAARVAQLRYAASEIGATPASRQRLAVSSPQADSSDPCRKYLR